MAVLGHTYPTLIDKLNRTNADGSIAKIVELLAEQNDILQDATYMECNDGSKHKTTMRTGIPEGTWREFNKGVQPSKSTVVPVMDTTGMLEDYGQVDKDLADRSGNANAFRTSENIAHLAGMNNKMARYMFYGSTASEPQAFTGLAPRYNDPSAESGENMVDAGGTGATNTSIWFVTWGETTTSLLYPQGATFGFQHRDLGEDTVKDEDGGLFQAYRDHYKWNIGMSVRDWRANARVCNIDVTALTKDAGTGADLIDLMVDAYYKMDNPMQGGGTVGIYCNRTIQTFLHKQAMNAKNVNLTIGEYAGKKIPEFLGMPIRRCDAILNTESAITFP
jgi:hypothetical protein